jgi:hypothetical protein
LNFNWFTFSSAITFLLFLNLFCVFVLIFVEGEDQFGCE